MMKTYVWKNIITNPLEVNKIQPLPHPHPKKYMLTGMPPNILNDHSLMANTIGQKQRAFRCDTKSGIDEGVLQVCVVVHSRRTL